LKYKNCRVIDLKDIVSFATFSVFIPDASLFLYYLQCKLSLLRKLLNLWEK